MATRQDDSGRSSTATTAQPSADDGGCRHRRAGTAHQRINHMPGAGSERAAAIEAGRREMLTDNLPEPDQDA